MRSSISRITALACLLVLAVAAGPTASASAQVERTQNEPNPEASGRLAISPSRIELDVQPGVPTAERITLTNDSDGDFDISLRTSDLGPATDPRSVAMSVEDGEFGAGDWLDPEVVDIRLKAFETITFDLRITPPTNAPIGTNLASLIVDSTPAEGPVGTADSTSVFRIQGAIQVFLTIPGPVEHDLRITSVDVRDTVLLGGQRFAVWDVTFRNDGTVNEHVSGSVNVRSLFGNVAHREKISNMLVLRGAKRTTRVVWRDLPWVGAFTPEVKVRGDDAKQVTKRGGRVLVMPWWLPVLLGLAIVVPIVVLWWRRRQEWKLYLEDDLGDEWVDDPDSGSVY